MDHNTWRNPAVGPGISRIDPYLTPENQGLPAAHLPPHNPILGSGLSSSLQGTSLYPVPFKPTVLSPFGSDTRHLREPEPLSLGLSPQKTVFSQQGQLPQISPIHFGSSIEPVDLSPPSQKFFPPPAHQSVSNLTQPSSQPYSVSSFLGIPERPQTFIQHSTGREDAFSSIATNRQELLRDNSNRFHHHQPHIENIRQNPHFEAKRLEEELQRETPHFKTESQLHVANPHHNSQSFSYQNISQRQHLEELRIRGSEQSSHIYNTQENRDLPKSSESQIAKRASVTVQAAADSTTKPKKGRAKKKREDQSYQQQKVDELQRLPDNQNLSNFTPVLSQYNPNIYSNNPQLSSPVIRRDFAFQGVGTVQNQQGFVGNSFSSSVSKNTSAMNTNYSCTGSVMGMNTLNSPYRNSPMQQETYNSQGMGMGSNNVNFIPPNNLHGIGGVNQPGQNRLGDSGNYPFNVPSNQPSFVDQLNSPEFDALEMEPEAYNSGERTLCNLDNYNAFNNYQNNASSTVDQNALSDLISNNNPNENYYDGYSKDFTEQKPFIAEPTSAAIVNPIEEDDEFAHLKKPPTPPAVKKQAPKTFGFNAKVPQSSVQNEPAPQNQVTMAESKAASVSQNIQHVQPISDNSENQNLSSSDTNHTAKLPEKTTATKTNKNNAFMDSFLSFLQGKKPETLSSVDSANVKKPQLPKYYPEPKRPPRPHVEPTCSKIKVENDIKSEPVSSQKDYRHSRLTASDDNSNSEITGTVKNIETGTEDHPSLKMKIKLQKTPPKLKKAKKSHKEGKRKRSKSHREEEYEDQDYSPAEELEERPMTDEERSSSPVMPARRASARKAKEKFSQKKYNDDESEVEEDVPETYDSDSDPAWTPIAEEKTDTKEERRGRGKITKPKGMLKRPSKVPKTPPSAKAPRISDLRLPSSPSECSEETEEEDTTTHTPASQQPFTIGTYVINRQDMNNFEGFPIWKIESGKMMRKFELFVDKGEIYHKSLSTYSSWLPNMQKNYVAVRTRMVPKQMHSLKDNLNVVQVFEEDRPKPKLDSGKQTEYENDPLADMFNVYLQVFLSQAMEHTFLKAILESQENFYLMPLQKIDKIIADKLMEMNTKVRWISEFKEAVENRPHIRVIDRSNLKSLCQATKSASQNAIKSLHLFGQPYDRDTLQETGQKFANQGSVEYMIGKTASNYISAYHSLHHFKYNLYKRCLAKVDIVREGNTELDNAEILDKCLNNRTWVLKIFEDLKSMLEKG